jgi:hypothetical protein
MRDQKLLEIVEYFRYLASLRVCNAGCKHEIKSRIAIAKAAFDKKKIHVYQQMRFRSEEETYEMLHL